MFAVEFEGFDALLVCFFEVGVVGEEPRAERFQGLVFHFFFAAESEGLFVGLDEDLDFVGWRRGRLRRGRGRELAFVGDLD